MADIIKTVKLREPISIGSQTIDQLEFRKPKAKDFRQLPLDPKFGDMLTLAGKIAGQPDVVMDELCTEDMMAVVEAVAGFMPAGLGTGV